MSGELQRLRGTAGRHGQEAMAMSDDFAQEQQDGDESGFDSAAFDDDGGGGGSAELEAAYERAANAELSALVERYPALADEQVAGQLVERATTVAADYGLDPAAASDPRWLSLVADQGLGEEPEDAGPHPDDIRGILEEGAASRRALEWL